MKIDDNIIPKPWKIISRFLNLNFNCEVKIDDIDLIKVREEFQNIIQTESFQDHSGKRFIGSGWGAIGLKTYGGDPYVDYVEKKNELKTTRILKQCPYIEEILNKIPGEKDRVRFMELKPGTTVFWHYDNNETVDELDKSKNVRLHLPIITSEKVELYFGHQRARWMPGKLYYGDFSYPHLLYNGSDINRVHLIIDVRINEKLINFFPKKYIFERRKRMLVKRFSQRSCNLYRKLNLIKS